jgi:thymidine phosphorylase
VKQGDVILTLHANDSTLFEQAVQRLDEAITISDTMPEMLPLIIDFIG